MIDEQSTDPFHQFDLDTAIRLRWALRDIRSKRHKFLPASAEDIATLEQMGLVETKDDNPSLTNAGYNAIG